MPMLMLKCRTCGLVFPGHYVPEGSNAEFKAGAAKEDSLHSCSNGHEHEYAAEEYMDWS